MAEKIKPQRRILLGISLISLPFAAAITAVPVDRSSLNLASLDSRHGDPERGAYVLRAAGCVGCHTKPGGAFLAGGRALKTPFGTFYTPNITPDRQTGIGGWSQAQFHRAVTEGVRPDGSHYFPAFPYTSYTRMTVSDVVDLKAYLDSLEPHTSHVRDHDLSFPFNQRFAVGYWKRIYFDYGTYRVDERRSAKWNRGAYLVTGPGHCGECHTPRDLMGGFRHRHLSGSKDGPDGASVPNITPHEDALGSWSDEDVAFALLTGLLPDGDAMGAAMGEVIEEGTSHLSDEDIAAIATYLKSLSPASEAADSL